MTRTYSWYFISTLSSLIDPYTTQNQFWNGLFILWFSYYFEPNNIAPVIAPLSSQHPVDIYDVIFQSVNSVVSWISEAIKQLYDWSKGNKAIWCTNTRTDPCKFRRKKVQLKQCRRDQYNTMLLLESRYTLISNSVKWWTEVKQS